MAYKRAISCEMLGKYRPAVLFFADAARWSQDNTQVIAALASLPLNLLEQGRLQEALEYSRAQVELFPNAVSYAVASLLRYHQGRQSEGDARAAFFQEQAFFFDQAREEFAKMPAAHQEHPVIKGVLGLGYEVLGYALHLSGDLQAALAMCDAAIAFDTTSANAWTLRGVLLSAKPEKEGISGELGPVAPSARTGAGTRNPVGALPVYGDLVGARRGSPGTDRSILENGCRDRP
jgi:tetratricopeptide (TPR) repeat protein